MDFRPLPWKSKAVIHIKFPPMDYLHISDHHECKLHEPRRAGIPVDQYPESLEFADVTDHFITPENSIPFQSMLDEVAVWVQADSTFDDESGFTVDSTESGDVLLREAESSGIGCSTHR
jgi:hypothetical protein